MSITYRKEIDGLRALAIIPVVLFHAGVVGFGGGFVGVDIFFVISGFLITSIIVRDINNGTFSFLHFFERRIRRIFPALIMVVFSTLVAGYIIFLYAPDLAELGKSLIAQSLFLSNIFFLRNENYFAAPAETFPLLHTWTLSVEEQFYILFPMILFFVLVYLKKKILPVILTIGVVSFIISIYLVNIAPGSDFALPFFPDFLWNGATNQTAGFFILPSRAWELMAGAAAAVMAWEIKSKKGAEILSAFGFLAIVYAITQFDSSTKFPGVAALVPVFGSLAIIVSNTKVETLVGKVLSLPLLVWTGLISYSLYLWHWPVLVYAKTIFPEPNNLQIVALVVLPVCLAWITYRLIETPFKKKEYFPQKLSMILAGLVSLVIMLIFGFLTLTMNFDSRVPAYTEPLFAAQENMGARYTECLISKTLQKIKDEGPCLLGSDDNHSETSFVLLGDSHAGTIVSTLDIVARENGVSGAAFIAPGCIPVSGIYRPDKSKACTETVELALEYIRANNIKSILFVTSWNHYLGATPGVFIMGPNSKEESVDESRRVFVAKISEMISDLEDEGRNVFIMKEIPIQPNFEKREIFYSSIQNGFLLKIKETTLAEHLSYNTFMDKVFSDLSEKYGVTIIDPANVLCSTNEICTLYKGDTIIYSNNDHLNFVGSNMLSELFQDFVVKTK